jgi:glycosyltransferase involved in cell wall biosynthesis
MIFNASPRGLFTHPKELVENLSNYGHEIHLIVPKTEFHPLNSNIKLYFIPRIDFIPFIIRAPLQVILSTLNCLKILKKKKIDIIYIRSFHFALAAILLSKIYSVKVILEVNGLKIDELDAQKNCLNIISKKIIGPLETLAERNVDAIRVVTREIKNDLVSRGVDEKKIKVIENGANVDIFKPIDKKAISLFKQKIGINSLDKIVIFVGSFYSWQGIEYLIQAAPNILEVNTNVRFLIVGDGIMKTKWIQLVNELKISDKFIFTGRVPYEAVPSYINTSDICVTPKKPIKSGYSPLKLYEYMACCKPVVATRTNGFEIIEEYNAGILINPDNSREFADAIKKLLHNNTLRIKYGRNGREYVIKNHSWESVVKKVADLCESTVNLHK